MTTRNIQHPIPLTDADKRRGLKWVFASESLNAFFAYITFGSSVFILYLSDLGLPKAYIGFLLSLFPFCGIVALVLAPWVARIGFKRTYTSFYGARKLVILSLLLTPWVQRTCGARGGVLFVTAVILIFALCRAIAETGFYPWTQECVPNAIRGQASAITSVLSTVMGIIALGLASYVISRGSGLSRYSLLIAIGSVVGIVSVLLRMLVPGGAPVPANTEGAHRATLRAALRDAVFRRFLFGTGCAIFGVAVSQFIPLFMKEQVGLPQARVVQLDIAAMVGTFLAGYAWGRWADRAGGKRVITVGLWLMALVPLAWIAMPRHSAWSFPVALALAACWGAANIGMTIGSTRLLFNRVIPAEKTSTYSAVWYAFIGLAGGFGALAAGRLLDTLNGVTGALFGLRLDLYTPVFLTGAALLAAAALIFRAVPPDTT